MRALLQQLTETPGPAGQEDLVRDLVRQEITSLVDDIYCDALGNLVALKQGSGTGSRRIMLSAHLDESGVVVKHIDARGFVRFSMLGHLDPRALPGRKIRFLDGARAVVGLEGTAHERTPAVDKMFLDFGLTAPPQVRVGDAGVIDETLLELGVRWVGKALDSRVGVAILIETLRRLSDCRHDVAFVFAVQNEVGGRGAMTAAYGLDPQLGLVLASTPATDIPKDSHTNISLGCGPGIKLMDGQLVTDRRVADWIVEQAEGHGLSYQLEVSEQGGGGLRGIQLARAGIPTGVLTIPVRYGHTGSEMVDQFDASTAVDVILALLAAPVPWL